MKKRDATIDVVRGIGIILVVIGHVYCGNSIILNALKKEYTHFICLYSF